MPLPALVMLPRRWLLLTTVATSGSESPIVGQAPGTRETFYSTDPTCQSGRSVVTDARHRREQRSCFARAAPLGELLLQLTQFVVGSALDR